MPPLLMVLDFAKLRDIGISTWTSMTLKSSLNKPWIRELDSLLLMEFFSMDGDIAPLPEIVALAKKYDAYTFIDECHATGVFGKGGKGTPEYFGLEG